VGVALDMPAETGVRSVKFFPMGGLTHLAELSALAAAAAERSMMVEPTGGIGVADVAKIVQACRAEGVPVVMAHLYGSLKDPATGELDLALLRAAVETLARA
jgi:2-dehydro-3-deoxy-phosphogluconate aldolase